MKAFVTGATGFLGSHLVRLLVAAGHTTTIFCRPSSNLSRLGSMTGLVKRLDGDIRDPAAIRDALAACNPDTVFHLAWSGVAASERGRLEQISHNLLPSLDLLKAAAELGTNTWVGTGSQAEYGPHDQPISETCRTNPTSLYGASKLATGHSASVLARDLGIRFAWARVFSTFGPGDNHQSMIPMLISKLLRGERPRLTPGEQRWDYLYVEDAARALLAIATTPLASGIYNLGSGHAPLLRQTIETIRDCINPGAEIGFGEIPYARDQIMRLQADNRRLINDTGWQPTPSLEPGIHKTIEWHKSLLAT